MPYGHEFTLAETHPFREAGNVEISRSSCGMGWRRAFMSVQREGPYSMSFAPRRDLLINVVNARTLKGSLTLDGQQHALEGGAGTITIMPAGKAFHLDLLAPVDTTHLYVRRRLLDQVISSLFPNGERVEIQFCAAAYDPVLEQLCYAVREGMNEPANVSAQYVDLMMYGVAAYLVKNYTTQPKYVTECSSHLSERQIKRTREIIDSRLAERIGLEDIAREFRLSADHFGRLFKRASGVTLYQFVIRCRVDRARKLLAETSTPIVEIAAECGFADQVHLTRAFGRIVGTTPAAYRRTHRGN